MSRVDELLDSAAFPRVKLVSPAILMSAEVSRTLISGMGSEEYGPTTAQGDLFQGLGVAESPMDQDQGHSPSFYHERPIKSSTRWGQYSDRAFCRPFAKWKRLYAYKMIGESLMLRTTPTDAEGGLLTLLKGPSWRAREP